MTLVAARRIVLRGQRHLRTPTGAASSSLHQSPGRILPSGAAASLSSTSFPLHHAHHQSQHRNLASFSPCRMMSTATVDPDDDSDADDVDEPPLFSSIPSLHPSSLHAIEHKMKITTMTEIQHKTFEAASSGRDILGRARTGTGKTLAFLLPAIENSLRLGRVPGPHGSSSTCPETGERRNGGIATLILSPTRELAMQIHNQAQVLAASHANGARGDGGSRQQRMASQVMYGGSSRFEDLKKLEKNPPYILVATPGRLIDHMQNSYVNGTPFSEVIGNVSVLVLDEADRCLDMGFRKDMEYILGINKHFQDLARQQKRTVPDRQTLLFSATLPRDLRSIMASHMQRDYLTVDCVHDVDPTTHTNASVDQSFVTLPPTSSDRFIAGLVDMIEDVIHVQNPADYKVVVFFPTTGMCQFFSHLFNNVYRIPVVEIHSKKTQSNRTYASAKFRKFRKGVLFTTDVSARGVDYPDVTHVIQYGSAETRETYVHRLGRTGRAGKKGRGVIIAGTPSEARRFVMGELEGLDVKRDERFQKLIDGDVAAEDGEGGGGAKGALRRKEINEERLRRIQDGVRGDDPTLAKTAQNTYRSLLGYHSTKINNLGMNKQEMVNYVNSLGEQMGFERMPNMSPRIVQTLNLRGVPGLNVSSDDGGRGGGGGGRYGDRGSRGRGGGGGRSGDRGSYGADNDGYRGGGGGYGNNGRGRGRGGDYNDDSRGYGRGGSRGGRRDSYSQRWESDY